MGMFMKYLLLLFILISGTLMVSEIDFIEQLGERPTLEDIERFSQSPNFDQENSVFENRIKGNYQSKKFFNILFSNPFSKDKPSIWFNSNEDKPTSPFPEAPVSDFSDFEQTKNSIKFIWFGHSTILVSFNNKVILIDPVFSDNATPVNFLVTRFQPPVYALEDIPKVDYIVISHDHYDHLDMNVVKYFLDKDVHFLVPLGVGAHLLFWGIPQERITELDWWQSTELGDLTFTATPSQHFSGRSGFSSRESLWASWVIKSADYSIFYSGDSGYDIHYKNIGDRYGPFDVVFMECGQYNELWRFSHNMPEEAVKGFVELRGKIMVPVHWGMFDLSTHNWYDPPTRVTELAKEQNINLVTPRLGQLVSITSPPALDEWWKEVPIK